MPKADGESLMVEIYWLVGIIAGLLALYLIVALLKPEIFA
jgi:K+-transporting ATPase KdpF subunit